MGSFGEKLRKRREERGIELDAISNTTKISTRMLRALEDEHFDQLPGGVFNKGFVRAYARQIGLDEEEAVTDYLAALRESQVQQQSILPDFRSPAAKPGNDAGKHARQLQVEKRQKEERRNNERRNDERRSEHRRNEVRRNEVRRNADHLIDDRPSDDHPIEDWAGEDRPSDDGPSDDRPSLSLSPPPDRAARPAANAAVATPPAERFPKKYPAGDAPPSAAQSSAPIPWAWMVLALLLVAVALAIWNVRRHREPASAMQAAATPAATSPETVPGAAAQPPASAGTPQIGQGSAEAGPSSEKSSAGTPSEETPPAAPKAEAMPAANHSEASAPRAGNATPPASMTSAPLASKSEGSPPPASASSTTVAASTGSASKAPGKLAPATASAAKVKPVVPFRVTIRAEKTTWVLITADGKPVAQETLIAPAHTSVSASREVVVKAGNAAGISFFFNNKEIPARGGEGEVRTYVFDANSVRVVPSTPADVPNH